MSRFFFFSGTLLIVLTLAGMRFFLGGPAISREQFERRRDLTPGTSPIFFLVDVGRTQGHQETPLYSFAIVPTVLASASEVD